MKDSATWFCRVLTRERRTGCNLLALPTTPATMVRAPR